MMDLDKLRENFSAVVDGELHGAELGLALDALEHDAAVRAAVQSDWQVQHLIGDVLRAGEQAPCAPSARFLQGLQARLQAEPALTPERPAPAVLQQLQTADAANDGSYRWKAVAGFASLAAVVAVVWNVAAGGDPLAPQLAAAPAVEPTATATLAQAGAAAAPASRTVEQPVTLASGEVDVMIRDARLDELLLAHKQAGGGAVLQMPAGFMRSATFAAPER